MTILERGLISKGLVSKGLVDGLISPPLQRWVCNFDSIDDYILMADRAINIDGDNRFEFYTPEDFLVERTVFAQCFSSNSAEIEFRIFNSVTPDLVMTYGGAATIFLNVAQGLKVSTKYGVDLTGTTMTIYEGGLGGTLLRSLTFTRGTAREPAASTVVCARNNNSNYINFFKGTQRDIIVNDTLWPISENNQPIQLPSVSGLGAEIFTTSVIENPLSQGTQWTYLGDGRWQYVGDGTYNSLWFLVNQLHPTAGFLEFEVESISGSIRCSSGNGPIKSSNPVFSTTGIKRYFYTSFTVDARIEFARNQPSVPSSCVIKNLSFKPLRTVDNQEKIVNGNFSAGTANWSTTAGGSLSVTSGVATLTTVAGQQSRFEQPVTLDAGYYYVAEMELISLSGNTLVSLLISRGATGNFTILGRTTLSTAGRISVLFWSPSTDVILQVRGDAINAGTVVVDNIKLSKVLNFCNPMTLVNMNPDRWSKIPV